MFETMILGAGPGGTGPLIWAAANGLLGDWLDAGIAVVDRQDAMGGTIGRYLLTGDTLGGTCLECLDGPGAEPCLVGLRSDPTVRALEAYRSARPPLPLVGRFINRLGAALAAEIGRHAQSCFLPRTRVTSLRLTTDGGVAGELIDPQGRRRTLCASSVVLALGGRQPCAWEAIELRPGVSLGRWRDRIVASDRLLAAGGTALAKPRLGLRRRPPRAVILGGSHSAFSVAWTLLEGLPDSPFERGGVSILYRSPVRVFYPSRAEALADGYQFTEADVCPATGRVHRLGGLRGDGRTLFQRLQGLGGLAPEDRAVALPLDRIDTATLCGLLEAADLIVPAVGYRLETVPLHAADGRRIPLARSGPSVDAGARLRLADGSVLPNVFGIGLGSGFRPWGAMAGEPSFAGQQNSLWLYQHGLGALIHDEVRRWAAPRRDRSAEAALRRASELAALCLPSSAPLARIA